MAGRFSTGYYWLNALAIFLWIPLRFYVLDMSPLTAEDWGGMDRETQIYATLAFALVVQYRKCTTLEGFLAKVFQYCKLAIVLAVALCDRRLGVWMGILFLLLSLAVQQPPYQGPSKVRALNGQEFEQLVEGDRSDRHWLCMFYAPWSSDCTHFTPTFARLSVKFDSEHLRFAMVDASFNTRIADKYAIDTSVVSRELPTLLLFRKGGVVEGSRLPPQGNSRQFLMPEKELSAFYDLPALSSGAAAGTNGAADRGRRGKRRYR